MFVGFLNYRGLGGEFIVLVEDSILIADLGTHKFYKIESLVFIPLIPFNMEDGKLMKKLNNFQKLLTSFGYYSIGESATTRVINESRKYVIIGQSDSPTKYIPKLLKRPRREEYSMNREMMRDLVIGHCEEWITDVILV